MDADALTTGQVAELAGVNAQTLRYYHRRGLLREPQRRRSGYRRYPPETVRVIRFIKRAQDLGFSLAEIEVLLQLREHDGPCAEVSAAARAKIVDIETKIRRLDAMRRALGTLARSCARRRHAHPCAILEALAERAEQERSARSGTSRSAP